MSVLTEAYAVPSRVIGVYRFLLHARGQRDTLDSLTRHLAPDSLGRRGERDGLGAEGGTGKEMVRKTVNECLAAKLLAEEGEALTLHPDLPEGARDPRRAELSLPLTLARLLITKQNDANHDLGLAIAWYLGLDVYAPPGNWPEVERILLDVGMKDALKLSDVRYHMLEDWLCYLGFAWTHDPGERRLVPDPTAHLRWRLPELFPGPAREPLPAVMARLAAVCPVFEEGLFRTRLRAGAGQAPNLLSTATALAWLRLRDEGTVELHHESDAPTLVLPDGDQTQLASHVTLVRAAEEGS
jgi:hypothetical protein